MVMGIDCIGTNADVNQTTNVPYDHGFLIVVTGRCSEWF